jgi:hypothetical protein
MFGIKINAGKKTSSSPFAELLEEESFSFI